MTEVKVVITSEEATEEQLEELANRMQEVGLQILDANYFRSTTGYVKASIAVEKGVANAKASNS